MSKRSDIEYLDDIKESINRIESYTNRITYTNFLKDLKTQDAVIRNLEIIGEAVKNLSSNLKEKHTDIEWKKIAGLRDKIIHEYFGINWDIVWDTIIRQIPKLKTKLNNLT